MIAHKVRSASRLRTRLRHAKIETLSTNSAKLRHLARYATLAPSTHNTQPWNLKFGDHTIDVFADFDKRIPQADPSGRDLFMSLGALTQNLEVAAREHNAGFAIKFHRYNSNQPHIATITFDNLEAARTPHTSPWLDAIVTRQNYRGFFTSEVPLKAVKEITDDAPSTGVSVRLISDTDMRAKLGESTAEGLRQAYKDPEFREEISSYINHNISRKKYGLHGHSLRMNLPASVVVPQLLKRKDIGSKLAVKNYESFMSAPAVGVMIAEDNERAWFESGRALEDIALRLTQQGLCISIYAAAIEMGDLRAKLAKTLKLTPPQSPQLLFCIGKPTQDLAYSARKSISDVTIQ